MTTVMVFKSNRTASTVEDMHEFYVPMTARELRSLIEPLDDDDEIVISHDDGFYYGSLEWVADEYIDEYID